MSEGKKQFTRNRSDIFGAVETPLATECAFCGKVSVLLNVE